MENKISSQQTLDAIATNKITFNDPNAKVEKTPIMILQEICMKLNLTTIYDNISTEGQVHDPIFSYRVTCGNISQTGKGNSKKKAKQAAALEMLNLMKTEMIGKNDLFVQKIDEYLKSMSEENDVTATTKSLETNLTISGPETNEADSNPIGDLLEITQKCSLRPPTFEFGEEEGPAHNKQFTCFIKFGDISETGTGRTKKLAKRNAATKLLVNLKSNSNFMKENQSESSKAEAKFQFLAAKEKNKKVGIDFARLKQSTNFTINQLFNNNDLREGELNKSMFEQLAKEEGFDFNYFRVPQNKAGLQQVLLQILMTPTTVVNGLGITLDEALDNASCNALNLVKLLCSR